MDVRITKLRLAFAGLFVLAGVGLASLLSPLVGTALATVGSTVNISDHSASAYFAKVDSSGKLAVGDGSGPLTVDGTVAARPAAPASPWRASEDIQTGPSIAGPSSVPINLTSLSLSTDATSNQDVYLEGQHVPSSATGCSGATFDVTLWHIRNMGVGVTPVSFSFPTPLQWKPPANTKACLIAFAAVPTPYITTMNAVGFYGG
jgi:hypothetical protein